MCVLAIRIEERSILVGATRDEGYTRPSAPPQRWPNGILAPRDLKAGGTWIGVAPSGRIVAVTNRFTPPAARSRGELVVEALLASDPRGWVRAHAREFGGFNVAVLQDGAGWVLHFDGAIRETDLGPGVHVLTTNRDVNEPGMVEAEAVRRGSMTIEGLPAILASHEGICKHGPVRGTVSASIVTADRFLHASGPPCATPFLAIRR